MPASQARIDFLTWIQDKISPELLDTFKAIRNEENFWREVSQSAAVPWERKELLNQWGAQLDIYSLSSNLKFMESADLATEFAKTLNWNGLTYTASHTDGTLIFDLIQKYPTLVDWSVVTASRRYVWNRTQIEAFDSKLCFKTLSKINFESSIDVIEKYVDRWDWDSLSANADIHWTLGLIKKFEKRLNWTALSSNRALPWTGDLIALYLNQWDWGSFETFDDGRGFIEKYPKGLSANLSIPFDKTLVTRFQTYWKAEILNENARAQEAIKFFA
jgi:hypothetical protein